jgi:uncharacterized lipoprotein YajG
MHFQRVICLQYFKRTFFFDSKIMKTARSFYKSLIFCLVTIIVPGCATTVNFAYQSHNPAIVESWINEIATCYFSVTDLRSDKDLIGYVDNSYGMKTTKVTTKGTEISVSIYKQFKDVLMKKGFLFTDDPGKSDYKLTFSINKFYAEMSSGAINFITEGECCIDILLNSGKDNTELYKGSVCGKGEKKKTMILDKNDIPDALMLATDNALDKILNGTELISSINRNIKR